MKVHFIGIGGIGMSALAQWFVAQKWSVTGSDLTRSIISDNAQKHGIRVKIGQKAAHIPRMADLVIRTQAIKPENPEYHEARRRGIPVLTYPEMVGRLTKDYRAIAIAGAHGKSTVTALTALVLTAAKFDPTVIVGTLMNEFGKNNFRKGEGDWLVLEADEYGKAFLNYTPLFTIITNIDAEHLDTYGSLAGVKNNFLKFIERTREGGTLILNRDDRNLRILDARISHIAKGKSLNVIWYSLRDPDAKKIRRVIKIPGDFNLLNALAVLKLAHVLKIPENIALKTIAHYKGSWRRMEYRGAFKLKAKSLPRMTSERFVRGYKLKALVYDDYAHHPTEIKATLKAFREKYPHSPIVCVFQPHQVERLKRLWREFQDAFGGADVTLLTPTYRVAGRDKEHPKYNAQELVRSIQKKHPNQKIFYLEKPKNLKSAITILLQTLGNDFCIPLPVRSEPLKAKSLPRMTSERFVRGYKLKAIIVMMGAGNIADYTSHLL